MKKLLLLLRQLQKSQNRDCRASLAMTNYSERLSLRGGTTKQSLLKTFARALLLAVFSFIVFSSECVSALRDLQTGEAIPPFSVSNAASKSFSLTELAGKKGTLLIFWQTSTKNSQKALRLLETNYAKWKKQGLEIVAVNVEEQNITEDDLKKIKAASEGLAFPMFVDFGLTLFDKLGVIALPTLILLDNNLVISREMSGFPLVGSQLFFEEVGYFLGDKRLVEQEVYRPVKLAMLSYQMGRKFEKKKDYDRAVDLYEKALKADPKYVKPIVRLMELYLSLKRIDEARALPAKIDAAILDDPAVKMSRGKLYYHDKDADKAMKMFAESLTREETPDACVYSGFISYGKGLREEAEASFAHAASLSNKSPEIMNKIGKFFAEKGEYARANGYYKQALEEILKTGGK